MLRIDYKSGLPIYEQIYRGIVKMAAVGAFGGDGQLPSVRSIAQELGVNPNTVQKAYGLLERDGLICSLPGKGSFLTGEQGAVKRQQEEAVQKVRTSTREALDCGVALRALLSVVEEEGNRRRESETFEK